MIRRPPRSTLDRSSAASDVYKRQTLTGLEIGRLLHEAGVPRDVFAVLVGGGEVGAASVSYTHLRAHETVLDLVCRLLLEKKQEGHRSRRQGSGPSLPLRSDSMGSDTD